MIRSSRGHDNPGFCIEGDHMFQTGGTISETLEAIGRHDLVLPAIQREFVWDHRQICQLFDSIMQGYPFGAFLYWQIEPETSGQFKFYDFLRRYHERDSSHCPDLPRMADRKLTAVLDGQQRLTALNIGLRGSMTWKLPYKHRTNPSAYPERRLYLDLLWQSEADEEGQKYRFAFLSIEDESSSGQSRVKHTGCWFPVQDILSMESGPPMLDWLTSSYELEQGKLNSAFKILNQLHRVVHDKHLVAFYEEKSQDIEKVLQIFIRTNSGGTYLSYSDMLLFIAVAQWQQHDARREIHAHVDDLNRIGNGFGFSKDLVLKAGLMLCDVGNVGFKVKNFTRENMSNIEKNWMDIKRALTLTVRLVSSFGFDGQTLRAGSVVLPIACHLYKKDPGDSYLTHSRFEQDRQTIREWMIRSILKASGIWGSGLDTLLTALREVIRDYDSDGFPITKIRDIMARRGKSLSFEAEELEELADMQFSDRRTFALLSLILPFVDLRNEFHVDHIFPSARFTERRLKGEGVEDNQVDDFIALKDGLANLQLLDGPSNLEKGQKMPSAWLAEKYSNEENRRAERERRLLGNVPESIAEFNLFFDARRARLKAKIEELLGTTGTAASTV